MDDFKATIDQAVKAIGGDADVNECIRLSRLLSRFHPDRYRELGFVPRRIAVLTGYTFKPIRELCIPQMVAAGVFPVFWESSYGDFERCVYAKDSQLVDFQPDLVFFCVGTDHLSDHQADEYRRWQQLWDATHSLVGADIIQCTFEEPASRVYGNIELTIADSVTSRVRGLNAKLASNKPGYVHLFDVDFLASQVGRRNWRDETMHDLAKIPVAHSFHQLYAHALARLVAGLCGQSRKCVVLDLDNTLWSGVVGDDGYENIEFGQGSGAGEAHLRFQTYLKQLSQRGILLAVCSKNDEEIAKQVFRKRTDFPLGLSDFSCFVANWFPKHENLRRIAEELNLGLHSLVFVDDNPAERDLVREMIPEVAVVELPTDPAGYVNALSQEGFFEVPTITSEDQMRLQQYQAEKARLQSESQHSSYEDFLASLEMVATLSEFDEHNLQRVTQLINKTNQFNVRTKRYGIADVKTMAGDPSFLTLCAGLTDRFGDNGIVTALIGKIDGTTCFIDTWVMSCRVFSRELELLVFRELVSILAGREVETLQATYSPTPKNVVIKDLFQKLGMRQTESGPVERTCKTSGRPGDETNWELDLTAAYPDVVWMQPLPIKLVENFEHRSVEDYRGHVAST